MTSVKKKNKLSCNSFISIYKNANIKNADIFFPYIEYIWCILIPSKLNFSFQILDFSSWAYSYLFGVNSFHISKVDCLVLQVKDFFSDFLLFFLIKKFFSFIFFSWRLITLQYCSGFCHTSTWISHGFTCIPHPDPLSRPPPHPIPLGLPSQCTRPEHLSHTPSLGWWSAS